LLSSENKFVITIFLTLPIKVFVRPTTQAKKFMSFNQSGLPARKL
jgi:hypothetical protein